MKKKFYLFALCLSWAFCLQSQAANVTPQAGVYYNIIQTPSNMVLGVTSSTQPVVQAASNSLTQAFQFVPVDGKTDTYYIKSFFGLYLSKLSSSNWSMTYLTATNSTSSEWVIMDDASSTTAFRLMLNFNSKYLATDATTENSYTYCDKAADHVRGLFTLVQATIPTELVTAYNSLTISGNLTAVTSDLTLASNSGSIPITWASSLPAVITTDGKVNRPDQYDAVVKLTATLTQVLNGVTYTMTKEFLVTVKAFNVAGEQLAKWDFASNRITTSNDSIIVTDSISRFKGVVMNDACIRTIGTTERFNVLDLGNGKGYLDLGNTIGKAIYSLTNYTMCGYFRIDDTYSELNNNGNFYWTFSNSADAGTDRNGYIIGSLKATSQSVSTNYWAVGNQDVGSYTNAAKGGWHHIAYTQNGTTGTVYIDGTSVGTGSITNIPATTLPIAGRTGTLYNWLGRSNYPGDVYLRNTLLYDFQLLRVPLTPDDLNFGFEVPTTIDRLNTAYAENPKVILTELTTEMDNLSLGDLSSVTSDITLPTKGTKDANISIAWKSTNNNLISATGVVTRPNYYSYPDTLTATLSKNGQKVFKIFPAKVVVKEGTEFTNNLLVKYDFATIADSVVTDAAEKHLTGTLKNKASIRTIGSTVKYNVLSLGDSIGYFDMGTEVGKLMYNLTDYTVGAYFRIDSAYTAIGSNGNFLWNFSNSNDIIKVPTGYIIGSLKNQANTITSTNWTGEQTIAFQSPALLAGWHYFGYSQSGTTGTIFIDGIAMATNTVTSLPSTTLPKQGQLGTLYNWIGRSCYTGDVYLRKTLVYDFRLYKTAFTEAELQTTLNIGSTINSLELAYAEKPNAVKSLENNQYKVVPTSGGIKIIGLNGDEKVSLFDVAGRQLQVANPNRINANAGVYIVKINTEVTKVVVK